MQIDLMDPDLRVLRELVSGQRKSLINEIAHTDDRAYRTDLRNRYESLERIAAAIEHAHAPVNVY